MLFNFSSAKMAFNRVRTFRSSRTHFVSTETDREKEMVPHRAGASRMQATAGVLHPKHDRADRQDKRPRQYRFSCSTSGRSIAPMSDPDPNNAECGYLKMSSHVLLPLRGYPLQAWASRRGLPEGPLICSPRIYPAPTVRRADRAFRLVIRLPGRGHIPLYRDKAIVRM